MSGPALAAEWPTSRLGDLAVWDAAYDPGSGIRYIPIQLIVPAVWDGSRLVLSVVEGVTTQTTTTYTDCN